MLFTLQLVTGSGPHETVIQPTSIPSQSMAKIIHGMSELMQNLPAAQGLWDQQQSQPHSPVLNEESIGQSLVLDEQKDETIDEDMVWPGRCKQAGEDEDAYLRQFDSDPSIMDGNKTETILEKGGANATAMDNVGDDIVNAIHQMVPQHEAQPYYPPGEHDQNGSSSNN